MIITLYSLCVINHLEFSYKYVFIFLAVLVIFQMIGGITDFYRSWRGVKLSAEMALVIKIGLLVFYLLWALFHLPQK